MSTYIYARVSTFDQYVNGYSIDQQVRSCLEYAKANGLMLGIETNCDVPGVFIDGGKSAYKKTLINRPGGLRLMQALKPGDTVVALATHRLFRRLADMVAVMDKWVTEGVFVKFVDYPSLNTDTANGKAMLYMMAVMAQLKSELISARVKESQGLKKTKPSEKIAKAHQVITERSSKDLGSIMQEAQRQRDAKQYTFNGVVRAYVRVSTKDQTVEHQEKLINQLLPSDLVGAPIVWYVDEGASAFKTRFDKRPAAGRLLKEVRSGDMIVAWRPDRLFRSLVDAAKVVDMIHKTGASITTIEGNMRTDTPQGRMLTNMMAMFAEIESQDISRMTKLGQFGAVGVNPAARAVRMPKLLREMKRHWTEKYYQFTDVFSQEDRFLMHIELYMTAKNYRSRKEACRVISNKWLKRKGLPTLTGEFGDSTKVYLNKLKKCESPRKQKVLKSIAEYACDEVRYPINLTSIAWVDKRQKEFLRVAKMFPGRLRDKQALTSLAAACHDPQQMSEFLEKVR
jgi:DNA invertase Pin-like site-specific DNA recombinase